MIQGTTQSGFAFTIEDEALNNFELLDVISEVDENPLLAPKALTMLLGKAQKKKLYNHLRTEDGIVPMDKIQDEMIDMFNSKTLKN